MKRFIFLVINLFATLNLSAAPLSAYLGANEQDLISLYLTNLADQQNLVILELVGKRLGLNYLNDLISTDFATKQAIIKMMAETFTPAVAPTGTTPTSSALDNLVTIENRLNTSLGLPHKDIIVMPLQPKIDLLRPKPASAAPMPTTSTSVKKSGAEGKSVSPTTSSFSIGSSPSSAASPTTIPAPSSLSGPFIGGAPVSGAPVSTSAGGVKKAASTVFGNPTTANTSAASTTSGSETSGGMAGAGSGVGTNASIILNIPDLNLTKDERSSILSYPDTQLSSIVNRIDTSLGGNAASGFTKPFMIKGSLTSAGFLMPYVAPAAKAAPQPSKQSTSAAASTGTSTSTGAGSAAIPPSAPEPAKTITSAEYFSSFGAPSSTPIHDLSFYETLQNDHTTAEGITNKRIIAALFAPQKISDALISNRSSITAEMGIRNEAVLDFLLRDRFNQNPETVRQMILQDKQIGLVRFLLPYELRKRTILPKSSETGGIGYVEYPSPVDAAHGIKTMHVRGQELHNSYRHLDFLPTSDTLWLINRHIFDTTRNDYRTGLPTYNDVSNFYWMPNGETFVLIYTNGKSGTYKGIDGSLVGELREPIVITAPTPPAAPAGFKKDGKAVQVNGETLTHFRARLRAKLNEFEPRTLTERDPAVIRAMAILTLDKTFTGLTDSDLKIFTDASEDDIELNKEISRILALSSTQTLLDQAILYYAIKAGKIPRSNPAFTHWNNIFNTLDAAMIAGQNTQGENGIPADAITNPSQLASFITEAIIRYGLAGIEEEQLGRPVSYTNKTAITSLITKDPTAASSLDKAKVYFLIKANIVKSENPKVVEWRSVLNI